MPAEVDLTSRCRACHRSAASPLSLVLMAAGCRRMAAFCGWPRWSVGWGSPNSWRAAWKIRARRTGLSMGWRRWGHRRILPKSYAKDLRLAQTPARAYMDAAVNQLSAEGYEAR